MQVETAVNTVRRSLVVDKTGDRHAYISLVVSVAPSCKVLATRLLNTSSQAGCILMQHRF